ncbi:hypothetical protein JR316_0008943 [Psilocybe cubensis]|uniref:Uncharacterized protein n=1 Tax=Psilocybe cubensis TaxID=181762 RepID=A0ACB8GRX0_PSICU|nr:hypothetical protein JR316_0008943 [Psilocybe cubensis]KAH9478488.1 hypothetical protein JR316_0008943 [Psilocybe cubensis]
MATMAQLDRESEHWDADRGHKRTSEPAQDTHKVISSSTPVASSRKRSRDDDSSLATLLPSNNSTPTPSSSVAKLSLVGSKTESQTEDDTRPMKRARQSKLSPLPSLTVPGNDNVQSPSRQSPPPSLAPRRAKSPSLLPKDIATEKKKSHLSWLDV